MTENTMTQRTLNRDSLDEMTSPFSLLDRAWEDWFGRRAAAPRVLRPAVDVSEDEHAYHFAVELPGLRKEEVTITIEDGVLSVSGERKLANEKKEKTLHRIERFYGAFQRSLTLPTAVDVNAAEATFTDGVLHIRLPKTEEAKPKTLKIR